MDAEQSPKVEKPLSILERFRQLTKDKEKEKLESAKQRPAQTVSAVYLSKNDKSFSTQKFGNDRGWKQNKWNNSNRNDNRRGGGRGRGGGGGRGRGFKRKGEWNERGGEQQNEEDRRRTGELMSIRESDVGITEFANQTLTGFTGILKQRFSDFNVNEIAKDGTIVKLTSLDVPETPPCNDVPDFMLTEDSDFLKVLKKEQWDELYSIVKSEDTSRSVEIEVTDMSKEDRVKIHNAIKSLFKNNVHSNTVERDEKKILKISYFANENDHKIRRNWKAGEFLHFVLYKENTDTTEAINLIAAKLRIKPSQLMYAGTKDKRARTTQSMCIKRMFPSRLAGIQPLRTITIGNYCFKQKPLRLGSHLGNRFRIAIRNVTAEESSVAADVASLQETGFVNYFGLQRFGQSVTSPTYLVGKSIVNRNWKEAVEVILRPRPGERSYVDVAEARDIWWQTRCAKSALKALRWQTAGIERRIWQTLADQHAHAYLNALESLPRGTLSLYCHAFQSLIWNRVLSRRIKELGLIVLAGDLVVVEEEEKDEEKKEEAITVVEEEEEEEEEERKPEEDGEEGGRIAENRYGACKVRRISAEEAGRLSIDQIVHPLPGSSVVLPNNVIGEYYREALAEEGVTMDSFKHEGSGNKSLTTMYGTYRNIITKPNDLTWKMVNYASLSDDLLSSELDELNGAPEIDYPQTGPFRALLIEFSLCSSSYATMLLRELMRCGTSSKFHANLTAKESEAVGSDDCGETGAAGDCGEASVGTGIAGKDDCGETGTAGKVDDCGEPVVKRVKSDCGENGTVV